MGDGQAKASVGLGFGLVPGRCLDRRRQRLSHPHLFQLRTARHPIPILEQVLLAKLESVQAQVFRDHIHRGLHGEVHLEISRGPEVATGNAVRIYGVSIDPDMRCPVDSCCVLGARNVDKGNGLEGSIGAAVKNHFGLASHNLAFLSDPRAQKDAGGMSGITGHELLGVSHDHLHRSAGPLCQMITKRRIHQGPLASKIRPDLGQMDHNPLLRDLDHVGQKLSCPHRHLVADPDIDPAIGIDSHNRGVRLDIALMYSGCVEGVFENLFGQSESLVDITQFPSHVRVDVGDIGEKLLGSVSVGSIIGMQQWGLGFHGLMGVEDSRHLFIFHVNGGQRILGHIGILCSHHRHFLTNESHPIYGQHRHVIHQSPSQQVGQVLGGEYGKNSRHLFGLLGIDGDNFGVGQRASQDLSPDHARQQNIGRILGFSGNLGRSLYAPQRLSYLSV